MLSAPINYTITTTSFRMVEGFVPICKWLEKEVNKRLPDKKTNVVYQGINPELFYKDEGFEFKHPSVGIMQNHYIRRKTLGLVNFKRVIEKMPEVHFYIGAEGGHLPLVKKAFSDLKNVHYTGRVSYPDGLRKFYTASDLYVLASGLDCCPTTVLEASLMKKPVLGSAVGGVPEIIDQGKSGWSIPNNRVDEWVAKINMLLDDRKKARKMGNYGRLWVTKNFDWAVISKQVERIFTETLEHQ